VTVVGAKLIEDLRRLGVGEGDTLLVRAAVRSVGIGKNAATVLLDSVLDALGPDGTLLSLSYTKSDWAPFGNPSSTTLFTRDAPTYAGAFPQCMLDHPNSIRSLHPTNSIVAIGKHAKKITAGHDHNAAAYSPMRHLIELNGKMALIGCVASNPGFTTAHLAEQDLSMGRLYIWPTANKCFYIDETGERRVFRRPDPGFCSLSFWKFYGLYAKHEILNGGRVGEAYSLLVPAKQAYDIELAVLAKNKKFNICDNPHCTICNMRRWDRLHRLGIRLSIGGGRHVLRWIRPGVRGRKR
jgi:aminoglycoside N3'-acetyltransferase